ncbi:MAG TPA: sugar ABC transporter permease [Polyangiaceae bacterium]|nr:sugar ABC transporter permease [Polyangiaceae bacterium]
MKPARRYEPYLMLLPTLGLLTLFFLYPLLVAARESFYSWDLLTPRRFVGGSNYRVLWERGELTRALLNTLCYSAVVVGGSIVLGLAFALLLDRPGKLVAFVRSAVFSAYVVSWVSVSLLFMLLLDADLGLVSRLVVALGLPRKNWLGDPSFALMTLAVVSVWKITGYAMIIFLAGLKDIPPVLHEAAALDGASSAVRFWRVTWPLLKPSAMFVGTTSLIISFQAFDVVRIMTQGGPVHATELFVYAIYEQIFMNLRVGRASALVVVFSVFILGLTALQLWVWRARGAE